MRTELINDAKTIGSIGVVSILLGLCLFVTGVTNDTYQMLSDEDNFNFNKIKRVNNGLFISSSVFTWLGAVMVVISVMRGRG